MYTPVSRKSKDPARGSHAEVGHGQDEMMAAENSPSPYTTSLITWEVTQKWTNDGEISDSDCQEYMPNEIQETNDMNNHAPPCMLIQRRVMYHTLNVARQEPESTSSSSSSSSITQTTSTVESTLTTSEAPTSTTDRPYFPDPNTLDPPPVEEDSKDELAKIIVEYMFLGLGILLLIALCIRRIYRLRIDHRPLSDFFIYRASRPTAPDRATPYYRQHRTRPFSHSSNSSLTHLRHPSDAHLLHPTTSSSRYPTEASFLRSATGLIPTYPLSPAAFAAATAANDAVRRGRGTRGADIGAGGRRGVESGLGISDHDGILDDKDALPAYDMFGGPPKYADLERTRGRTPSNAAPVAVNEESGGGGGGGIGAMGTRIAESVGGLANRLVERLQGNRTPTQSGIHLPDTNNGAELELRQSVASLRGRTGGDDSEAGAGRNAIGRSGENPDGDGHSVVEGGDRMNSGLGRENRTMGESGTRAGVDENVAGAVDSEREPAPPRP
ncbi:hypothetical protein AX16_002752 [Volvariella volvacea WC 439]|nr:hypothetical protein AX16_002752 [Volvariella volvacea WC 439]